MNYNEKQSRVYNTKHFPKRFLNFINKYDKREAVLKNAELQHFNLSQRKFEILKNNKK